MKRKLTDKFRLILPSTVCAAILLAALGQPLELSARPRSPGPPFPDDEPVLIEVTFDAQFYAGATNDQLIVPGEGTLNQSWSGYSLERDGAVTPFIVPGIDTNGWTNLNTAGAGAFRFWLNPYWTSTGISNGASPGAVSVLLELDAASGTESALAWSLQVSADGNTLALYSQTDSGLQEILQTSIAWAAGTPHNVALSFNSQGTALFVDGELAAQGSSLPSIPPSAAELVLGSTLAGTNSAGADIDEFYSFGKPLTASDVAVYYAMVAPEAALGPLPDNWTGHRHHRGLESMADLRPVYDPDTGCATGGPPYLTNLSAVYFTNQTTLFSGLIAGGTNGVLYDIYATFTLDKPQFNWIGQGLACSLFSFYDQPADYSFYIVKAPSQTMAVTFGNTSYGSVPSGLSNSIAVAAGGYFDLALQSNGTIIAWGDNTYGQTNVTGITNAVAIAAGQYHGLALLATGEVKMWGYYSDGSNFFSVTNSYPGIAGPPTSNVMAIAAGIGHDLAVLSNGTVVSWGLTNLFPLTTNSIQFMTNLTGAKCVACGWNHDVVLLSNGLVKAWGLNASGINWNLTNVPTSLTDAVSISAFGLHSMALRSNGTVVSWGCNWDGATNVPPGLSNVVEISAGGAQSIALQANGTLAIWGLSGLTNVPAGLVSSKVISGGFLHNLVLQSDLLTPIILEEPSDQYAPAGSNVTFSVVAQALSTLSYQWQFNGTNLSGQTTNSLTLTNVGATNNGNYQVIISTRSGSIDSSVAAFTLVVAPEVFAGDSPPTNIWVNNFVYLNAQVDAVGQAQYPLGYQLQLNGTNISTSPGSYKIYAALANDGNYTLTVTNIAGSNSVTWDVRMALPGMAESWGDDSHGECDRPASLTNVTAIAAGTYHSLAATDSGMLQEWGEYAYGTNFYALGSPPAGSNFVAVAASEAYDLALTSSGSVTNWGLTNDVANSVPTNLSPAIAIAAGKHHNVAILTNGTVTAWGDNSSNQLNIPSDLTNGTTAVTAIAAGDYFSLALRTNGIPEAWGDNTYGQCTIPATATNIVSIAAGGKHCLALTAGGKVIAWGLDTSGQTNVPTTLSNVLAVAAGAAHSVALLNTGSLAEWGDNTYGQSIVPDETTNVVIMPSGSPPPPPSPSNPVIPVKLIAAGGNHTMAAIFSPLVQYPVDVSKDLLLIYNTNSLDSSNVCMYYLTNRPMVSKANVLGIGCVTNENISPSDYTNIIAAQVQTWLTNNPTERPAYVILFQDIPSRVNPYTNTYYNGTTTYPSVQYQLNQGCAPNWQPFVTSINMNGTNGANDCIAYINKLASIGSNGPTGLLVLSAQATGYGNTNYVFDDTRDFGYGPFTPGLLAEEAVVQNAVWPYTIFYTNVYPDCGSLTCHITNGNNIAGYLSWGEHSSLGADYAINQTVNWSGNSGWYLIETIESFNGMRLTSATGQGNFLEWFSANAFGGTGYSNTPIGAVSTTDEPNIIGASNPSNFFGLWVSGKNLAISAWNSRQTPNFQVTGDPLTKQ